MKLKEYKWNIFLNLFIVILIFFLDRFSKIFIINYAKNNFTNDIYSSKFLNIQLIWNEGIAFGLFSFHEQKLYNLLTILIFAIILIIFFMIIKSEGIKKYSLIFVMGGAVGNIYDRIFFKAVPDFIDFHIGNFHWFIFNVADIFITIGVFSMILLEFTDMNKNKKI